MPSSTDPGSAGRPSAVLEAVTALAGMLRRAQAAPTVLQDVLHLANATIRGADETSVLVIAPDSASCLMPTGTLAADLDRVQCLCGEGPAVAAAATGEIIEISDVRADGRWAAYRECAERAGALSALALPLPVVQQTAAALTFYGRRAHAFGTDARAVAATFASYAAVALAHLHAHEHLGAAFAHDLDEALTVRAVIDRATGIVMERHRVGPARAAEALDHAAAHAGRPLEDVAGDLVTTGAFDSRYLHPSAHRPDQPVDPQPATVTQLHRHRPGPQRPARRRPR